MQPCYTAGRRSIVVVEELGIDVGPEFFDDV
jgi:hypothetical protein